MRPAHLSARPLALAVAAAAALDADLIGVDLLPVPDGYTVIEMNGAVEFDGRYSLAGEDIYAAIADALALVKPSRSLSERRSCDRRGFHADQPRRAPAPADGASGGEGRRHQGGTATLSLFVLAVLAGAFIALGAIFATTVSAGGRRPALRGRPPARPGSRSRSA